MNKTYHVSKSGSDLNDGSRDHPFLTINRAARIATPTDTVIVHEGTYREWVSPAFGGTSSTSMITYSAAEGEKVIIKGSEIVKNWTVLEDKLTWFCKIENSFFKDYNPYTDIIYGDWFDRLGRDNHTGEVYLNESPLNEAVSLDSLLKSEYGWFATVDENLTKIYARFGDKDPNKELVEINVRRACFFPLTTGEVMINLVPSGSSIMRSTICSGDT